MHIEFINLTAEVKGMPNADVTALQARRIEKLKEKLSKRLKELGFDNTSLKKELGERFLGKEAWQACGMEVGEEPEVPLNLQMKLSEPCPNGNEGKFIKETHRLVLIPKGMTLSKLRELEIGVTKFIDGDDAKAVLSEPENPAKESYWVILPDTYHEGSNSKYKEKQLEHLIRYSMYERCTLTEHMARIFLTYKVSEIRLFEKEYARCDHCGSTAEGGRFDSLGADLFRFIPANSTLGLGVRLGS